MEQVLMDKFQYKCERCGMTVEKEIKCDIEESGE